MQYILRFRNQFLGQSLAVFCSAELTARLNILPKFTAPLFFYDNLWLSLTDRRMEKHSFPKQIAGNSNVQPVLRLFQVRHDRCKKITPKISHKNKTKTDQIHDGVSTSHIIELECIYCLTQLSGGYIYIYIIFIT